MTEPNDDLRVRVADALATELDRRGVACRRVDTQDVSVLIPDNRDIPPIWITPSCVRWGTGPGVRNQATNPLDRPVAEIADRALRGVCPICGGSGVAYAGDDEPRAVPCRCQDGQR